MKTDQKSLKHVRNMTKREVWNPASAHPHDFLSRKFVVK